MEDNLTLYRTLATMPGGFLATLDLTSPIVHGKGVVRTLPIPMKLHTSEFYSFFIDDGIEERPCLIREHFMKEGALTLTPGDIISFEAFHSDIEGSLCFFLFDFEKSQLVLN